MTLTQLTASYLGVAFIAFTAGASWAFAYSENRARAVRHDQMMVREAINLPVETASRDGGC